MAKAFVAAESGARGRGGGHRPAVAARSLYSKASATDTDGLPGGEREDERCSPTLCQVALLFFGITLMASTLTLLQSLKSDRALCLGPRSSLWASSGQPPGDAALGDWAEGDEEGGLEPNDGAWLLRQASENGTSPCGCNRTAQALVFGLPQPSSRGPIRLASDRHHQLRLMSLAEDGGRRCSGGDFYETDLTGANWRSRPPTKDLGDGSYLLDLRVDGRLAGLYTLKVILLFSNLHGLDLFPDDWIQAKDVLRVQIEFVAPPPSYSPSSPAARAEPRICTPEDFKRRYWEGRWTRAKSNESCRVDEQFRYRCLDPGEPCQRPWCDGPVGRLESNGWVYSAHCAFRIFVQDEAWRCLRGRRLFFWGDSNHQDTIRNLLNFVLGRDERNIERTFQATYANPGNASEVLKITSVFNGHYNMYGNNFGLASLNDSDYRQAVRAYFFGSDQGPPDVLVLNSGLHDGKFWPSLDLYASAVHNASEYWEDIWQQASPRRPQVVFRSTVAPAGESRKMPANPQKMEVFNTVLREGLTAKFGGDVLNIVDAYDMTFPWHYDNVYSDGGHYGRPPSLLPWFEVSTGHEYFVDVMLGHVLLNAICPA